MGVYYNVTAGYGIIIDDENIEKIHHVLKMEDDWPLEVLAELHDRLALHSDYLDYGHVHDQMASQGTPGGWFAYKDHVVSGEPRSDFEPGLTLLPGNVGDGPWLSKLRNWLYENDIEFKQGFFFGLTIS